MFVTETGAYLSEELYRCPLYGRLLALPTNILKWTRKACQGQTVA